MEVLSKFEPFLFYGLIKGFIYALLAVGFCLVYKTTRIFNIAYGFVYTSAAYFALFFLVKLSMGVTLAVGLSLLLTCALGWGMEKLVYFPLKLKGSSPGVYLVSSIGVYVIGINMIALIFGSRSQILNTTAGKPITIHVTSLTRIQIFQFLFSLLLLPGFFWLLKKFKLGKKITALSNDAELFKIFGWNEKSVRSSIFILSSLFAGTASLLLAFDMGMTPYVGMNALLIGAAAMIIGGTKNIIGAAVAGICLGIIQNVVVWLTSARWEQAVTFGILILYLLVAGKKISGKVRIEEE
ncbi:MAG: branched-chain amino acid ABC transporter permease [Candidatus Aminicenantes bacterium]|jgi:branched-chain amino acid transport system permease protein